MTTERYFFKCVLLFVISKCYGIGIEYYDDQNMLDIPTEDATGANARRFDNEDYFKNYTVWHNGTIFPKSYSTGNYDDKNDNKIVVIGKHMTVKESLHTCKSNSLRSFVKENTTVIANSEVTTLPSDTLKEYEYIYDEDTKPQILLRQHASKPEPETEHLGNNRKSPLTEFYNLEPVVEHINLTSNFSITDNFWYIQEDLPCWELPVLYGEINKKKKYSDVFLIQGGELKNVIERNNNDELFSWTYSKHTTSQSYYNSKWCTVEPCYGDHTLCLFSARKSSSLCKKEYKVHVPKMSEQTALVNTLNSMRNKVASGKSERYSYLPPAANMKQIIYDYDLEEIAKVWLHQCLPGPAPCSALDGTLVTQLECTKYAKFCCANSYEPQFMKCTPQPECFILPVIGCLHVWYWSAGEKLTTTDVLCGHTSPITYNTAQILWARTNKIGCAYAQNSMGDIRVVCNFSPGAPFMIDSTFFCGIVGYKENPQFYGSMGGTTDIEKLMSVAVNLKSVKKRNVQNATTSTKSILDDFDDHSDKYWGIQILSQIYKGGWVRKLLKDYQNVTKSLIARLVVKYDFTEENSAKCDSDQPIYMVGAPGSLCVERGRRYQALCYDFRDPTPGYRLVAVVAPIALFSLILYDLFSGVVRQTNY